MFPQSPTSARKRKSINIEHKEDKDENDTSVLSTRRRSLQNHSLQVNQDWHGWRILEMVEIIHMEDSYHLTFQAEQRDSDDTIIVRKTTFEGHLWICKIYTIVNGIKTPQTKWYRGKLWVPARPSPKEENFYGDPAPDPRLIECYREQMYSTHRFNGHDPLVPPKIYGSRARDMYKPLGKSDKENFITPGTEPVDLEVGKLKDFDGILNDCATFAMQDHLIQTDTLEWEQWHVLEIQKARREGLGGVTGNNYYLTFRVVHEDFENTLFKHCVLDQTLEAEVWDGMGQRRVNRFRAIMPHTTDWFPGNFWIPT